MPALVSSTALKIAGRPRRPLGLAQQIPAAPQNIPGPTAPGSGLHPLTAAVRAVAQGKARRR